MDEQKVLEGKRSPASKPRASSSGEGGWKVGQGMVELLQFHPEKLPLDALLCGGLRYHLHKCL
jgi:hypothetical protein